jgi:phage tail sheath protein FI
MALYLNTPGVYIDEVNAFPNSVVAVETALPAFIGYTARASYGGESKIGVPIEITSMSDFLNVFGAIDEGARGSVPDPLGDNHQYKPVYHLSAASKAAGEIELNGKQFNVVPDPGTIYYLYNSLKLFYANGGGKCYIVSVGLYGRGTGKPLAEGEDLVNPNVRFAELKAGLDAVAQEHDPTIIVVPDATLLRRVEYQSLMRAVLDHCGRLRNRVAIFDVYGGHAPDKLTYVNDQIVPFRVSVGVDHLMYGMAYYPFVKTSIFQESAVDFKTLGGAKELQTLLPDGDLEPVKTILATIQKPPAQGAPTDSQLEDALRLASKAYCRVHDLAREKINTLPPSAAMAGVFTRVDSESGVWQAPANVSLASVSDTTLNITDAMQEGLHVDALTGKSINAIRVFTGRGAIVWGARTLDGNSNDWRYISVRRTVIMIEESIKLAAGAYVFEPNAAPTWLMLETMISDFLMSLWRVGGLAGAKPAQAFSVSVGLGKTMTPQDILEGIMRVSVLVAISRPAEFMVITVSQKMQTS